MTTSDDAPDALQQLDAEREQLREEIQGLHAQLREDGPMDAADRSTILTQVEELEGVLSGLDQRRLALVDDSSES
jgi:hypothetical protein